MSIDTQFSKPKSLLWEHLQWVPEADQIEKFVKLQNLLREWNQKINLTKLIEGEDYWLGQILDSLLPLKEELKLNYRKKEFIDVGSGCGFPGLAIAIAIPWASMTLVDSTKKKALVLKSIVNDLELNNRIKIINQRIESMGQNSSHREQYDFAFARALASSNVTAEYLIPLINTNGEAILFKGKWNIEEEEHLKTALEHLNAKISKIQKFNLPNQRGERHIIRLIKESKCPKKFPRAIGIPGKVPL
tara:strand:- start:3635 stop:4372 length:738 start_codon:yes stop_codon:yes gene_type:complete